MKKLITLVIVVAIIAVGIVVAVAFVKTRPEAKRRKPPSMTPVVTCQSVSAATHDVTLSVLGTVVPARAVELKARVSGEIVEVNENWIPGGRYERDAAIVGIDDADYEIAVRRAEAELAMAQSELALERGRQDVAQREWELLVGEGDKDDRELALRGPQLKAAQAKVASAGAALDAALLASDRTRIRAPFDCIVTARHLDWGDIATPQSTLGTLVSTEAFHVRASVPVDQIRWIVFPGDTESGSRAKIVLADGTEREGRVIRLLADLEPQGRMARVLVEVKDPLDGDGAMLLNSYVQVRIAGRAIENSYRINREYYREGGRVWLMTKDDTLRIVETRPVWSDRESVIVRFDRDPEERVVTSALAVAIDKMALRVAGAKDAGEPQGRKDAR